MLIQNAQCFSFYFNLFSIFISAVPMSMYTDSKAQSRKYDYSRKIISKELSRNEITYR